PARTPPRARLLHSPPPHRDRHSLPPRRSSDLHPDWGVAAEVTHDGRYAILTVWLGTDRRNRVYYLDLRDARRPRLTGDVVRLLEDRKSTRLNSSHQIISYAVFCMTEEATTAPP